MDGQVRDRDRARFVYPMVKCAPPGVADMKSDAPKFQELQLDDLGVFTVVDSEMRCGDGTLSLGSLFIVFCGALRSVLCAFSFGRVSSFSVGTCMSTTVDSDDDDG